MLPDLRFVLGATLATVLLGVLGFGLATTVRLSHEAKISPLEVSRSLAYAGRGDFNRFADPELTRTFEAVARTSTAGADAEAFIRTPLSPSAESQAATADQFTSALPKELALLEPPASAAAVETVAAPQVANEAAPPAEQDASNENTVTSGAAEQPEAAPPVAIEPPPPQEAAAMTPADAGAAATQVADTASVNIKTINTPTLDSRVVDTTPTTAAAPSEARTEQMPTAQASAPAADHDVEHVANVETATIPIAVEEQVEAPNVIAPQAEPAKVLQSPAPKARRTIRIRASKAKVPKAKVPKAKVAKAKVAKAKMPKAKALAGISKARPKANVAFGPRTVQRQWTSWPGYQAKPQRRPTSWGWNFNK